MIIFHNIYIWPVAIKSDNVLSIDHRSFFSLFHSQSEDILRKTVRDMQKQSESRSSVNLMKLGIRKATTNLRIVRFSRHLRDIKEDKADKIKAKETRREELGLGKIKKAINNTIQKVKVARALEDEYDKSKIEAEIGDTDQDPDGIKFFKNKSYALFLCEKLGDVTKDGLGQVENTNGDLPRIPIRAPRRKTKSITVPSYLERFRYMRLKN